jgi:hypothetical protein
LICAIPYQLKRTFRTAIPALCPVMSVGVAAAELPRRLGSQAPQPPGCCRPRDRSNRSLRCRHPQCAGVDRESGRTTHRRRNYDCLRRSDIGPAPGTYVISVRVPAFLDHSQVVIVPKDELAKVGIVIEIANRFTLGRGRRPSHHYPLSLTNPSISPSSIGIRLICID